MPKYIDIHAHTNFKVFDADRDVVLSRALSGDTWVINVGTQFDTSKKAAEMTNEYEGIYATIGLHPIHTGASFHDESELGSEGAEFTSRGEIFDKEKYRELAKNKKVVGIGECGLDYYRTEPESIEKQKVAFIAQVELASELDLALMLHIRNNEEDLSRNAYADVLEILKNYDDTFSAGAENVSSRPRGVVHFFAGTMEDANAFIDFGFYISFAGVITYKPRKDPKRLINYEEIIRSLLLAKIMADTDSPYVAPMPYRGQRNEPVYVKEIVKKIAEIKGLTEEETAATILANAKNLFNLS